MNLRKTGAALLACALVACSGTSPAGGDDPPGPEPAATTTTTERSDPAATATAEDRDTAESPTPSVGRCIEGTSMSPWSHSVPDDDIDEEACAGTSHRPGPPCDRNSDCGICHDGSNCGRPANREEIERLGSRCCLEDAAECEPYRVRCCDGQCRVTSE